jgi:hypothetical protein
MLSCECNNDSDIEPGISYYIPQKGSCPKTKHPKKCCDCDKNVESNVDDLDVFVWCRLTQKQYDNGDESGGRTGSKTYRCEACTGLADNLEELGYCRPGIGSLKSDLFDYSEMQRLRIKSLKDF